MEKIGIATIAISGANNYGNKLQTYALQEFLRQNCYAPELIQYEPDYVQKATCHKRDSIISKIIKQSIAQTVDDFFRIVNRAIHRRKISELSITRINKFRDFEKQHIRINSTQYFTDSDFSELAEEYDCFIAGSDQIWNPYYEGSNAFYYLDFAPAGKRITYAPSIAVDHIPLEIKPMYHRWLHGIDFLSIREFEGKSLILKEFGLDAKVVCDPVFLLDRQHWHNIAKAPAVIGKFFVVYILGKKTTHIKKMIRAYEKLFGVRALDIYTADDPTSLFAGPEEFLGLIEKSEFVLTDSFHGTAFSIIFDKPVVTVERNSEQKMSSRINSLLRMGEFGDRSAISILNAPEKMPMSLPSGTTVLNTIVNESKKYLLRAIGKAKNR